MKFKYVSPIIYSMGSYVNHNPKTRTNVSVQSEGWPSLRLRRNISFKERNQLIKDLRNG